MPRPSKALTLGAIFLAGVGAGVAGYRVYLRDRQIGEAKQRWFICTLVHQTALAERAELYHQKIGRWPATVRELVESQIVPEWSEVHFCPSALGMAGPARSTYEGSSFVDQNRTGSVSHFSSSPYRFLLQGTDVTVRCDFDPKHR